jgi:hypothetical protein
MRTGAVRTPPHALPIYEIGLQAAADGTEDPELQELVRRRVPGQAITTLKA